MPLRERTTQGQSPSHSLTAVVKIEALVFIYVFPAFSLDDKSV